MIRPTDTLKVLRKACELCGVGKSGGKATVYRRLAAYVAKHRLELQSHPAAADQVIPQQVTPVVEPSTAERELHELTHLPFQPWCTVCMQNKGRSDPHKGVDATHRAQTVVSFDFSLEMKRRQTANLFVWFCMTATPDGERHCRCRGVAAATPSTTSPVR